MYWRYGLCFLSVIWIVFAICGQVLIREDQASFRTKLAKDPKNFELLQERIEENVAGNDLNLAQKQLVFLSERLAKFETMTEIKAAQERLVSEVEILEQRYIELIQKQTRIKEAIGNYPEHRDLLYLEGVNEFNLMNEEMAMAKFKQAVDLDPLFYAGWETIDVIKK